MPGGAPQFYQTAEALKAAIDDYLNNQKNREGDNKLTISGLAYHLGFMSRQSCYDYAVRGDEFSYIMKRAILYIESVYESRLQENNPTGAIFWLKNHKWTDKQEIDQNHSGGINITWHDPPIQP